MLVGDNAERATGLTKVANLMYRSVTRNEDPLAQQSGTVDGEQEGPKSVQEATQTPGGMVRRELRARGRRQGGAIGGGAVPDVTLAQRRRDGKRYRWGGQRGLARVLVAMFVLLGLVGVPVFLEEGRFLAVLCEFSFTMC
jgi:hypothetical protein